MAAGHATAFKAIEGVEVVACADISREAAEAFGEEYGIPNCYQGLEEALSEVDFDAAANVTPDAVHYETTLLLLKERKHVFCEKPLATSFAHAMAMTDAAKGAGLVNGVNLSYRDVSALQKAQAMVANGSIGAIRHFEASYLQSWLTQPAWGDWASEPRWLWRLSKDHGSHGTLGDVGIHILDFATFAIGSPITSVTCRLKTFDKAEDNKIGEYKLDANDSFVMTAELENGATGVIHASRFASGHINDVTLNVFGTDGGLQITNQGELGTLKICSGDDMLIGRWKDVSLEKVPTTYQRFSDAVMNGTPIDNNFEVAAKLQGVIDCAVISDQSGGRVSIS